MLFSPDAECKRMRFHCNQAKECMCVCVLCVCVECRGLFYVETERWQKTDEMQNSCGISFMSFPFVGRRRQFSLSLPVSPSNVGPTSCSDFSLCDASHAKRAENAENNNNQRVTLATRMDLMNQLSEVQCIESVKCSGEKRESALKNSRFRHSSGHFNCYNYSLVHALGPIRINIDRMICSVRIILLFRVVLTRRAKWNCDTVRWSRFSARAPHIHAFNARQNRRRCRRHQPRKSCNFIFVDFIFSSRSFNLTTHGKLYSLTCSLAHLRPWKKMIWKERKNETKRLSKPLSQQAEQTQTEQNYLEGQEKKAFHLIQECARASPHINFTFALEMPPCVHNT